MTFVLHPLSHYNSITEPRTWFLLSLLEHLTIDFPFHFILSLLDVCRDSATCDKLIFPSTIMRILHHFSVPFLKFDHFHVMCAIDVDTIKRSKTQFCLRQSSTATPPTPFASSTSAPFASVRGVTLNAIMMQLQLIDARLDTLTTEMYQVNTYVLLDDRLTLVVLWSLLLLLLRHLRHPRTMMVLTTMMMMRMEMLALLALMRYLLNTFTLCHSWQKGGVVLDIRVVILRGRISIGDLC